jgi:hypothetical protein
MLKFDTESVCFDLTSSAPHKDTSEDLQWYIKFKYNDPDLLDHDGYSTHTLKFTHCTRNSIQTWLQKLYAASWLIIDKSRDMCEIRLCYIPKKHIINITVSRYTECETNHFI